MTRPLDFTVQDLKIMLLGAVIFELFLVLLFSIDQLLGSPNSNIKNLVDLDYEGTIASWFTSIQLFLIGLFFLLKKRLIKSTDSPSPLFFLLVGCGFIFLSLDEAASIHENVNRLLRHFDFLPRFKGKHGLWMIVYIPIGVVLALTVFRSIIQMWHRYRKITKIMAGGMIIFILGAIVLEVISYQYLRIGSTPSSYTFIYALEVGVEEFLEMFGTSLTLYGSALMLLHKSDVPYQIEQGQLKLNEINTSDN